MKLILINFFIAISILLGGNLFAQENEAMKFSLKDAQEYAVHNSYSSRSAEYDLIVAKKKVWETISEGLPQASASANYTANLKVATSQMPAEFFGGKKGEFTAVQMSPKYSSGATFTANQKIFDGSYIVGTMASKVFVRLSSDIKEKTEIEVKEAVNQAYYLSLVALKNRIVIENNLSVSKALLKETDAYYKAGFREELDVDQVRLMLKSAENQLSEANRQINTAKIVLKFSMGIDIDTEIVLTDELDNFINPIRLNKESTDGFQMDSHIDFKTIDNQVEAQRLILKNEYFKFLPKLDAVYTYGRSTAGNRKNLLHSSIPWYNSSYIGISASIPLFTSWGRVSKLKQEKVNLLKVQLQQQQVEQKLKSDISVALGNLFSAQEKYENDVDAFSISKRIYDRTQIKFNEGVSSSTELSQNEQQYIQSHITYINSTLNLLNAKTAFDKSMGNL